MSRLSDFYSYIDGLRNVGLEIGEGLEQQLKGKEEDIIKEDVLPVIAQAIETTLQPVRREILLVVDYTPGEPVSVSLSRRSTPTKELTASVSETGTPMPTPPTPVFQKKKGPRIGLRVTFPDGTVIQEPTANETMRRAVLKIGVEMVRMVVDELQLWHCGVPIISDRRDGRYGKAQMEIGNGLLLMTNSNTYHKAEFLEQVSDALNLNLKIQTFEKSKQYNRNHNYSQKYHS